jgi:hypothetical protein
VPKRVQIASRAALLLLAAACDEYPGDPRPSPPGPPRQPIEFVWMIHPGRAIAGPVHVQFGVRVGPHSCWRLEAVVARLDGLVLQFEGTAVADVAGPCAAVVVYDTVAVTTPALLTSHYYDLAAGDLVDYVMIWPDSVTPAPRLVARGSICPPLTTTIPCYRFEVWHPRQDLAGGWIANWPALTGCISAQLWAEILSPQACGRYGTKPTLLRIRHTRL